MTIRELWLKLLAFLTGGSANDSAMEALERGIAYLDAGDLDLAIAAFTEALWADPEFAEAYYNRGNANRMKGEFEKAIADYTEAIWLDARYEQAWCNRGSAYCEQGEHAKAIEDIRGAIAGETVLDRAHHNGIPIDGYGVPKLVAAGELRCHRH